MDGVPEIVVGVVGGRSIRCITDNLSNIECILDKSTLNYLIPW